MFITAPSLAHVMAYSGFIARFFGWLAVFATSGAFVYECAKGMQLSEPPVENRYFPASGPLPRCFFETDEPANEDSAAAPAQAAVELNEP